MNTEEALARLLARQHFERREWRGACPKHERTNWLVDKYWPQWRDNANEILQCFAADAMTL